MELVSILLTIALFFAALRDERMRIERRLERELMINNYETKVFCDECLYKGLMTGEDGKQWLTDDDGVKQPHAHSENWVHLQRQMES